MTEVMDKASQVPNVSVLRMAGRTDGSSFAMVDHVFCLAGVLRSGRLSLTQS